MGGFEGLSFQQFWSDIWGGLVNVTRTMTILDGIDILCLTFVIYQGIKIVRETRAGQLVKGIAFLAVLFIVSSWLGLKSMSFLLQNVFQIGVIALLVVFQPELRRALERLGRTNVVTVLPSLSASQDEGHVNERIHVMIDAVVEASKTMSMERTGALMVFELKTKLGEIISTGTVVNAVPSAPLICNIFFKNSPLHDGAMILRDGKVYAAGCYLPLSDNDTISRQLGTRHRASLGMSENSDALVIVVSEETGFISYAQNGKLVRNIDTAQLRKKLEDTLLPERHPEPSEKKEKEAAKKESGKKGRAK